MAEVIIRGTGHYAPENVVSNFDLSKIVDTSDEWITTRTGIKERRITAGENTSHIACRAAESALKDAGITAEELDLIIVATVTPDNVTPSVSCMLQSMLGARKAAAFDINAACTGFIYGLNLASMFIKGDIYNNILVVGAETLSKIMNWQDRGTCVLFGDGAGAAIVSSSTERGVGSIIIGSDGAKGEVLQCKALPINNPFLKEQSTEEHHSHVIMEGREVFRFATGVMVDSIEEILRRENLTPQDIKFFIPHQANLRIIDYAAKKLEVDISKFVINLERFGNTSSASIPIALDEMNKNGLLSKGDRIIIVGFGGGLTYGAAYLQWQK
ncbi:MAG: beta-ketoacyl-ACP synthase III [Bacillota bacterium]|nr:beta-ketoacyl-ACP synthase III [Bacillota bacterium]